MSILNIAPVTRAGIRLLISLYGLSETGKTLSGLKLAAGIEPDPKRRLLLDTEGGERGRAYVDLIDGGYLYAKLTPPFTPERYIEALNEIEAAGVNVLVIDSVSHAWFAEGGVLDMVEAAAEKNDMAKWAKPKRRLGKMTRRLMSSDMHIILCSRAKQPLVEEIVDGRKKLVPGPVVPVQEKTLRYDMTIMAQMLGDGRFSIAKADGGKCPGSLRPIFEGAQVMGEEMGRKLAAWAQAEGGKTPEQRQLEVGATEAAEAGVEALKAYLGGLADAQRAYLRPNADNYRSIARAADATAAEREAEEKAAKANAASAASLDDPFGAGSQADAGPALADGITTAGSKPRSIERYKFQPLPGKGSVKSDLSAMDFAHEMREALATLNKADREKLAQLNGGAMKRLHEEEQALSEGVMNVMGAA